MFSIEISFAVMGDTLGKATEGKSTSLGGQTRENSEDIDQCIGSDIAFAPACIPIQDLSTLLISKFLQFLKPISWQKSLTCPHTARVKLLMVPKGLVRDLLRDPPIPEN